MPLTSRLSLGVSLVIVLLASIRPAAAVITDALAPVKPSKIKVETFAQGLEHPWGMQFLPDGRLLVTERLGRMRLISKDGKLSPIEAARGAAVGQGGLLDVLLAPDFATTGIIYLSYGEPRGGGKNATSVARAKLVFEGEGARLEDAQVIFRQQPATNSGHHFGSRLVWGRDGTLFITTGERNSLRRKRKTRQTTSAR
jgi:glucose/arabinose dehydrogenase